MASFIRESGFYFFRRDKWPGVSAGGTLSTNADAAKAKELIEKAEANRLVSNSMKARLSLEPTTR